MSTLFATPFLKPLCYNFWTVMAIFWGVRIFHYYVRYCTLPPIRTCSCSCFNFSGFILSSLKRKKKNQPLSSCSFYKKGTNKRISCSNAAIPPPPPPPSLNIQWNLLKLQTDAVHVHLRHLKELLPLNFQEILSLTCSFFFDLNFYTKWWYSFEVLIIYCMCYFEFSVLHMLNTLKKLGKHVVVLPCLLQWYYTFVQLMPQYNLKLIILCMLFKILVRYWFL